MISFTPQDWEAASPERKADMAGELAAEALAALKAAVLNGSPDNIVKHYADDYAFWRSDENRSRAELRHAARRAARTQDNAQ